MFTLQILDRGQTFLHSLDATPVLLGSGPSANVVLREDGIAPEHVRIEPAADGARAIALAPMRVNGAPAAAVTLALGDRIEIGRCVIVVGRAVTRPARADDVLAEALPRRRPAARSRGKLVPLAVAVAVLGVVGWFAVNGKSSHVSDELAQAQRLRVDGHLDRARANIERLERLWAGAEDDRLQRLAGERQALAAIDAVTERLTAAVLDAADARGYAEWSQELRRLEHDGEAEERLAARAVRGNLRALIDRRPPVARGEPSPAVASNPAPAVPVVPTSPPPLPSPRPASTTEPTPGPVAVPEPVATSSPVAAATVSPTVRVDVAEIDRLVTQGLFAQAIALLQASLAEEENESAVARLETKAADVRAVAQRAMAGLLEEAALEARDGDPRAGALLLHGARHRFPPTAEFAAITATIRSLETLGKAPADAARVATPSPTPATPGAPEAAGSVDPVARAATLAVLRSHMEAVRAAEERSAFAETAAHLRTASDAVRERDADFAARLAARADEMDLLAAWHDAVAAAAGGKQPLQTQDARGEPFVIRAVEGHTLVGGAGGAVVRLQWAEVPAAGVAALVAQVQPRDRAGLGAAALLYRAGDRVAAESLLARLVRTETAPKGDVDRLIARGRGEPFDPRGYTLGKDGFVAVAAIEIDKAAKALASRLDAVLRAKDPTQREALWAEVVGADPGAVPVAVGALKRDLQAQVKKLATGPLEKQLANLAAQRAQLDAARTSAKELIFDEKKYFYPYKPPAVSGDRYAEYVRVQAEIDRRVASLRAIWDDERGKVRVPSSLRGDLDRLDWVSSRLGELGELDHALLARVEWARALPAGDSVTVRDYCATVAERQASDEWRRVEAYNGIVARSLNASQRELLAITNGYRAMFGHRPLAIVKAVCEAATGHADEMSRLGYFAHMSPTPGRRTPYDRMKLAGYTFGVSENIALVDGALGAHVAWCHSSGHHRNLLDPEHREFGLGANGRYWVQNFGSGTAHRDDPAWTAAAPAGR